MKMRQAPKDVHICREGAAKERGKGRFSVTTIDRQIERFPTLKSQNVN